MRRADACYVLEGARIFKIPVPKVQIVDTTGAGDILAGALVANYVRTREFLWSACFGVAASSLSLRMIALSKVDIPMTVDEEAAVYTRWLARSLSPDTLEGPDSGF